MLPPAAAVAEQTHLGHLLRQLDERLLPLLGLLAQPRHLILLLGREPFLTLEGACHLFPPHLALLLEAAHVAAVLGELHVEFCELGLEAVLLGLGLHRRFEERRMLVAQAGQVALGNLELADELRDLLLEADESRLDLAPLTRQFLVLLLRGLELLDGVEAGAANVVVASRQRTLAVVLVAVERDRVEAVRASVGAGNLERLANDRAAKDLLERRAEVLAELELVDPASVGGDSKPWRRRTASRWMLTYIGMASFDLGYSTS